jgi:hypothetical protein
MLLEELCERTRIPEKVYEEIVILKIYQMLQVLNLTVFGNWHQRTESNRLHCENCASVFNMAWNCRFPECNQFADWPEILESISDNSPIYCES